MATPSSDVGSGKNSFLQTTLFGTCIKSANTVHRNPKNLYGEFVNLFVNVQDGLGRYDAVRRAQAEWHAAKRDGSQMVQNCMDNYQKILSERQRKAFPKFNFDLPLHVGTAYE